MATYTDLIQRSTSGTDPLVPQPLKGRKMATPDAATMKKLVQQGKAMPAPGQDRPGRFNIRNGGELDDAIKAVGRVPAAGRPKVRKFIMARADALKLTSKIPDTWNADGTLKDGSDGDSSDSTPAATAVLARRAAAAVPAQAAARPAMTAMTSPPRSRNWWPRG